MSTDLGFRDTVLGHVMRAFILRGIYYTYNIFQLVLVVNLYYKINLCTDLTIKAVNLLARFFFFSGEKKLFPFPRTHYSRRERGSVLPTHSMAHMHTPLARCAVFSPQTPNLSMCLSLLSPAWVPSIHTEAFQKP